MKLKKWNGPRDEKIVRNELTVLKRWGMTVVRKARKAGALY